MNNSKIVPGVVLIALGIVFLLRTLGYVEFNWYNIFYMWPVLIVILGVNLIFANNRSPWATGIKIFVILAGLGVLLFGNFDNEHSFWARNFHIRTNWDDYDNNGRRVVKVAGSSTFSEPFHSETKLGNLSINGGAAGYYLKDTTDQLFVADTREWHRQYKFTHNLTDSVATLDFDIEQINGFPWKNGRNNEVKFKLNTRPVWDIDLNVGAAKLDFDLSPYKVRRLELNGGAADFDVKFGMPLDATHVSIQTGAADVTLYIPKDAACRLEVSSGLSSKKFEGFNVTDDDNYETSGFATAKKKFYVEISGGMSDFRVKRY